MTQRDDRQIGTIYRIGQIFHSERMLSICTAYNHNTSDVVGLFIVELPDNASHTAARQWFTSLPPRRRVHSSHVLHIHDWGIDGQRAFIATDPPRGVTLQHLLNTENIDLQRVLTLSKQLVQGIQALHEQGISGLDLRPPLITIDSVGLVDRVQIDDIGLRKLLMQQSSVQPAQSTDIGYLDPRYAPPEYITGGTVGPWSDIYQVGLLFFELVTGRPPFVGQTHAETGILQNTSSIPRMSQYNHDTPESFQDVVNRMLQKSIDQRYKDAATLLTALEQLRVPSALMPPQPAIQQPGIGLTTEMPKVEEATERVPQPARQQQLPSSKQRSTELYAYLSYEQDGKETHRFPINYSDVVIGRRDPKRDVSPDIDLTEVDTKMTISRQHARIRFEKTFFYIEDLKSRNKTRLGQLPLTPLKAELLQHGDMIYLGSVALKFLIPGMSQAYTFRDRE